MLFRYEGRGDDRNIYTGKISAASREAAMAEVQRRGLTPILVIEIEAPPVASRSRSNQGKRSSGFGLKGIAIAAFVIIVVVVVGFGIASSNKQQEEQAARRKAEEVEAAHHAEEQAHAEQQRVENQRVEQQKIEQQRLDQQKQAQAALAINSRQSGVHLDLLEEFARGNWRDLRQRGAWIKESEGYRIKPSSGFGSDFAWSYRLPAGLTSFVLVNHFRLSSDGAIQITVSENQDIIEGFGVALSSNWAKGISVGHLGMDGRDMITRSMPDLSTGWHSLELRVTPNAITASIDGATPLAWNGNCTPTCVTILGDEFIDWYVRDITLDGTTESTSIVAGSNSRTQVELARNNQREQEERLAAQQQARSDAAASRDESQDNTRSNILSVADNAVKRAVSNYEVRSIAFREYREPWSGRVIEAPGEGIGQKVAVVYDVEAVTKSGMLRVIQVSIEIKWVSLSDIIKSGRSGIPGWVASGFYTNQ